MSIRGIFASHSSIAGDRVGDLASRVLVMGYTGTAPMLAMSSGMPKTPAGDTAFSWTEDAHISGNAEATAAAAIGATTLTVDDTNIWTPNTVIMNQNTGEYMLIMTIVSDTSLTVQRAIAGTTAAAVTIADRLQHVGTAFEEAGGKPTAVTQRGESRTNYVQIFKNGWAISGSAKAVKYHSGGQLIYNRNQALGYHVEDIERSFIFGRPGIMPGPNGKQLRLSGGAAYQVETFGGLIESAASGGVAGQLNLDDLLHFIRVLFDRNVKGLPNERISFTGSGVIELINRMVRYDTRYNIEVRETEFGIKVMKLLGFNGDLTLATHPLFTENSAWGREFHVYHPGLIKKRVLRDTWEEGFDAKKSNNNGIDAEEGFIATETGFEIQAVETMGIMRNIQVAVASPPSP